jgi:catechol 2,3-dioxygenase-like lactoylglutathione lyase family enzyme
VNIDLDTRAPATIATGLHVADLDRSLRFYRDTLGCRELGRLRLSAGTLVALQLGNSVIKLLQWDDVPDRQNPPGPAIGLRYLTVHVADPDTAVAACAAAGFVVVRSAYQFSGSIRNAIVEDPDGTMVELCHGLAWE